MTQMAPVPDFVSPEFGGDQLDYGAPAKWSIVAIVGFIFSFLLVLAPVGISLGIVGIFRTKGGQRRGRGLSIAAIPIGLVVSVVTGLMILIMVFLWQALQAASKATSVLKTSKVHVAEKAAEFYDQCSRRFQLAVSPEEFENWLTGVIDKHGSLLNTRKENPRVTQQLGGEFTINYTGEFVNGAANIAVTLGGSDGFHPEVFDIAVDGVSAIPESKSSALQEPG